MPARYKQSPRRIPQFEVSSWCNQLQALHNKMGEELETIKAIVTEHPVEWPPSGQRKRKLTMAFKRYARMELLITLHLQKTRMKC